MKKPLLAVVILLSVVAPLGVVRAADPYRVFKDVRYTMDDGVPLAADVYLPPSGKGPFPCLVELTPYRKELRGTEGASFLPSQGFALIEVDARGTGGSGGEYDYVFSLREQRDAAEVIDQAPAMGTGKGAPSLPGWAGRVCTDKVGMFGGSYSGIIQYLVASLPKGLAPRHLVAIAPQRAYGDLYRDIVYQGGMVIGSFGAIWSGGTTAYYSVPPLDVGPSTDADTAWVDHLTKNDPMLVNYLLNPYIDAKIALDNTQGAVAHQRLYTDSSILPRIANLHVPVLHLAGWFDAFTRGQMLTFETALRQERADPSDHGPNYLIVGPWNHSNTHFITPASNSVSGPPDMDNRSLRNVLADWYRYWLAGGPRPSWMNGPRVHYYTMKGSLLDATGGWRTANSWPDAQATYDRLYLRAGGGLSRTKPAFAEQPSDMYAYVPAAGTGELLSRWDNAASGSIPQPEWDQRTDEPKGLSFTTAPFGKPFTLAGPMNLHLVASTQQLPVALSAADTGLTQLEPPYVDTDFVVKIADVAPDGTATLITQGYLRASHRTLDRHGSEFATSGDLIRALHYDDALHVSPPPLGEPVAYDIEIWPTAKTFVAGHSLRLDIYSADTPGHLTLIRPALNTVFHSREALSYLTVPVLPN